ncbi:MBL fold metallo-hydrolase [Planococcus maritimus]|uniref:MBL fold metallo-hydrolase n=1 Tax=Planococcus maritimus TaxID=192421 RepID=A0A7D7MCT9_PLAMR|nr:MBL fold metallo-hydrolase [Planococcus maritimus]QMT18812.1 MBL fold metallo-hydrolase [Planococcus maritimus]
MLKIDRLELGPVQTNCYIISGEDKQCIIFDPGEEAGKIQEVLKRKQLTPLAILLTHAHFDHIGAVDELRDIYKIPVYLHHKERDFLGRPNLNGSGKYAALPDYRVADADEWISDEQTLEIGPFQMELFHTPGHSPGSVSFYFAKDRFAIVGDTLFSGSIGRTDLTEGSESVLLKSIRDSLLTLPEETFLFPGHGPETTPGQERQHNPFLRI